jgi:hypothetical protein
MTRRLLGAVGVAMIASVVGAAASCARVGAAGRCGVAAGGGAPITEAALNEAIDRWARSISRTRRRRRPFVGA